jgi:micrococcal nuclease
MMNEARLYRARLKRVVDGDTVDLCVDLGFYVWVHVRFRLVGIDAPERGQPNYVESRSRLMEMLAGDDLYVESTKTGKYGRWLGRVYVGNYDYCVNDRLVIEGLAEKME